MRVAVLMGGISSEREISLKTGKAILSALLELNYDAFPIVLDEKNMITDLLNKEYDLAFIALHGEFGEDGRIQAVLDIIKKPYTGSGFSESAIAMDKNITKSLLKNNGILIPKSYRSIEMIKSFPVVIKPALEGSSVGLYICENRQSAEEAFGKLKDKKLVIEEFIKGTELTVGILNGEGLGVLKIIPKSGVYDFDSKYTKGKTEFEYPARIANELYNEAVEISEKICEVLNLKGGVRADYILRDNKLYFLEVNTIPGMTETSLLPKLASLKGYSFKDLVDKMVKDVKIVEI